MQWEAMNWGEVGITTLPLGTIPDSLDAVADPEGTIETKSSIDFAIYCI
jgi:hypothetical protein